MKKEKKVRSSVGKSIIVGMKEAIAWSKGESIDARTHTIHVPDVDLKKLRMTMQLSQAEFAIKYGFPLATIRNWEQGRREPELSAKILLAILAKRPDVVEEVLCA